MRFPITDRQETMTIDRDAVRRVCRYVCSAEKRPLFSASVVFVDDAEIHDINRRFLDHNRPTDVISFPLTNEDDPDMPEPEPDMEDEEDIDGEIIVSAETARREAKERGLDERHELLLYVIHGLLHLMDYDDLSPVPRRRMHARQEELLKGFLEN